MAYTADYVSSPMYHHLGQNPAGYGVRFGPLTTEESHKMARSFEAHRDRRGTHVPRDVAFLQLKERTSFQPQTLNEIWAKSDLDRDGRLSLPEFVCALYIAELMRTGQNVPAEVTPQQQRDLAQSVSWLVAHPDSDKAHSLSEFATNGSVGDTKSRLTKHTDLGHLAKIFAEAARTDPNGELHRVSNDVMRERRDLEQELTRQRDLKGQLQDYKNLSSDLHDQHCHLDTEIVAAKCRINHLQEELEFLQGEVRLAENDLDALRDAGNYNGAASPMSRDSKEALQRVRGESEMWMKDKATVDEMLRKIEGLIAEKMKARSQQQVLLEQQREIEHDRNLILTAIEGDYAKLHTMRAERLQMWDERNGLEKQLLELQQAEGLQLNLPDRNRNDDKGIRANGRH